MNMQSVMPAPEKPADSRHTSDKTNTAKKNEASVEDNEMFSQLLLMLSASGNNKAMSQTDGPMSLSSSLNHAGDLQKAPLAQSDPVPLVRHLQFGELQKAQLSRLETVPLAGHLHYHELKEDDGTIHDPAYGNHHSPGMEIPLPAIDSTEAHQGSSDMKSFMENFNKHMEQGPDMTADVMPEISANFVREITGGNSNDTLRPHFHTGRPDMVSQLSETLVDLYHIGGHSAKIRLQPEELGHLHIDISVVDDRIKAIVTVEENSIKDILETNINMLFDKLKGSGLNIDQFTVNISSSYHHDNMTGGWSDGRGREMFHDNSFIPPSVHDDTVLHDSGSRVMYAGTGGLSIFV